MPDRNISYKFFSKVFKISLSISFLALPLIIPSWHGKLLLLLGISWLFIIDKGRFFVQNEFNYVIGLVASMVIFSLLSLFYSDNLKSGFSNIETITPLLILPLIIFNAYDIISDRVLRSTLICFVAGVIILNLASLAFISYDLWDPINLQSNIVLANNSIVQIHPAFVSLYLSFCIFFLIDQYFPLQTFDRSKLGWILFSLVILITYLIWINSRTGILSFCIALIFYSFYRFTSKSRIITLLILALFFIIIYSIPFSQERFFNAPKRIIANVLSNESKDPNIYPLVVRRQIFDCSIELLRGPHFFYGYGTGDFRDALRDCYKEKNYSSLYEKGLDSHNEYFAQMHRHGVIGLLLFVALLMVPFRYALKYRSPLLAVFVILFAITALFENVFSSQKGVTFFALFCPILMMHARKKYETYPEQGV